MLSFFRGRSLLTLALLALAPLRAYGEGSEAAAPPVEKSGTRAEAWRRARLEKAKRTRPPRQGFLERQILAIEKAERPSILSLQYKGFHPTFASVSSGSRVAPGVRFWAPDIGGSALSLHASAAYSIAGYQLYDLQFGRMPHRGDDLPPRSPQGDDIYELGSLQKSTVSHLILYGSFRYRYHPRERFHGLGPDSRLEDRTSFLLRDASYDVVGGWQLGPRLAATLRAGYLQPDTGPGKDDHLPTIRDRFGDESAPGLDLQPDFWRLSAVVLLDLRDQPFNPHRGGMLAASWSRYEDRDGDAFRFDRVAVDARGYLPLGSPQRVLAVRLYTSLDDPAAGARVPFYLQEALGNSHTLRGWDTFRFRGEKLLSLQAEYRWEAAPAVELALFVDAGKVFAELSDWNLEHLRTGYGAGLRVKTWKDTLVRFDVGHGREGTRTYLRFGASF